MNVQNSEGPNVFNERSEHIAPRGDTLLHTLHTSSLATIPIVTLRGAHGFLHGARPSARASATSRERGGAGLYFHRLTCLYFHRLMFTKYTPVYKPRRPQSTDWRGGPVFMNVQNTKAPNVFNERSEQHPSRVLGSSAPPCQGAARSAGTESTLCAKRAPLPAVQRVDRLTLTAVCAHDPLMPTPASMH